MKQSDTPINRGRRRFLGAGLSTAAGVAVSSYAVSTDATTVKNNAVLGYPEIKLANLRDLKKNTPYPVFYPDTNAPGVLLKLGQKVEGGVGPDNDIVGFSTLCPHQGFALQYNAKDKVFSCPGHYSRFDAEVGGQQIWGHACQNLPQYLLRISSKGDIFADGLDELLYGRLNNSL